ncbi:hypothetical protein RUND412_003161 [Rhizina undulata]
MAIQGRLQRASRQHSLSAPAQYRKLAIPKTPLYSVEQLVIFDLLVAWHSSSIIDMPRPTSHAVAYFYCKYGEIDRQEPQSILSTIVKQLSLLSPEGFLPKAVISYYEEQKKDGVESRRLGLDKSTELIHRLSKAFEQTVIIIDALDECNKETRYHLLVAMKKLRSSTNGLKIFLTSRNDADIRIELEMESEVYIQPSDNSSDIERFVVAEVEKYISTGRLLSREVGPELKQTIIDTLIKGADGMFLWVRLQLEQICKETSEMAIRKAFQHLPKDLEATRYPGKPLSGRNNSKVDNLRQTASTYPRDYTEAVSIAPMQWAEKPDDDNVTHETLLDVCQNLVVIDKELAQVCLTLLCCENHVNASRQAENRVLDNYVLRDYVMENWAEHIRLSGDGSRTLAYLTATTHNTTTHNTTTHNTTTHNTTTHNTTTHNTTTDKRVGAFRKLSGYIKALKLYLRRLVGKGKQKEQRKKQKQQREKQKQQKEKQKQQKENNHRSIFDAGNNLFSGTSTNPNGYVHFDNIQFDKVRQLGKGSYGNVWLIENKSSKQKLVCKEILIPADGRREYLTKSFEQECSLLRVVVHPNVVNFFGFQAPDENYNTDRIYMEYCEGGDLSSLLEDIKTREKMPLGEDVVWQIVFQLAAALAYMHHGLSINKSNAFHVENCWKAILHSDIKPSNVLVSRIDEICVKFCDLGVGALHVPDNSGTYVGTPSYKPPFSSSDAPIFAPQDTIARLTENSGFEDIQNLAEKCIADAPEDRYSSLDILQIAGDHISDSHRKVKGWENCRFTTIIGVGSIEITSAEPQNEPLERLKLLMKDGIDLNRITDGPDQDNPLHVAAKTGNRILAERLLEFGAETAAVDGKQQTALDLAKDNRDMVQLLLGKGVSRVY